MKDLSGKKLLVIGGTAVVKDVLKYARQMGVYTIAADDKIADDVRVLADEAIYIDAADTARLAEFIRENGISGVMTGASDKLVQCCIDVAESAGLSFYLTKSQWDICENKASFKALCRKYSVPSTLQFDPDRPETFEYPVIVKPVDAQSARGISVAGSYEEYTRCLEKAMEYSPSKRVVVEKYMENRGETLLSRYIIRDGKAILQVVGDRWVMNPEGGKSLITRAAKYPSKHTAKYIAEADGAVRNMLESAGFKNGCLFMEAIPAEDGFYFFEMGYRISGGMSYKISEMTTGANELKMLISHTLTGEMCDDSDAAKIDPYLCGKNALNVTIPIEKGVIGSVEGLEEIKEIEQVISVTQYHHAGAEITEKHIGTLDQLFARLSVIADDNDTLAAVVDRVNSLLSIKDTHGNEMYIHRFNSAMLY